MTGPRPMTEWERKDQPKKKVKLSEVQAGDIVQWGRMPIRTVSYVERASIYTLHFTDGTFDNLGSSGKVWRERP